jgi:VanZ family protein
VTRNRFLSYWLPVLTYAALILAVSSIPGSTLQKLPFTFWDKAAHVVEYGVFSLLVARALRRAGPRFARANASRVAVVTVASVVAFGALDELYQATRGRDADPFDLAADAIGATLVQLAPLAAARAPARREA